MNNSKTASLVLLFFSVLNNKKKKLNSALAAHCIKGHHQFDQVTAELVHPCGKGWLLNRLEEVETVSTQQIIKDQLLNDMSAIFLSPFVRYFYSNQS